MQKFINFSDLLLNVKEIEYAQKDEEREVLIISMKNGKEFEIDHSIDDIFTSLTRLTNSEEQIWI